MDLAVSFPPKQIYLVGSDRAGWQALRALVRTIPGISVGGETRDAAEAVRAVTQLQPDGVLVAVDVDEEALVDLVARLREAGPESKLLVFGGEASYELEIALAGLDVDSFLLWEDLTSEAVLACLYGVLVAGLRVVSPQAVRTIVVNSLRRDRTVLFTEQQRLVLRGLAAGLTDARIAEETGLGERTVERRIGELKAIFGVATRNAVIDSAHELGFGQ